MCLWPFACERNLFFDNELNELSLNIPANLRGKGILHPWTLWHLNKMLLLIPETNYFLPPFVPKVLQDISKRIRPKFGRLRRRLYSKISSGPTLVTSSGWPLFYELYRKDRCYRNIIEQYLNDEEAFPKEIFNHVEIKKIWEEFLSANNDLLFEIYALISFGALHRIIPCNGIFL